MKCLESDIKHLKCHFDIFKYLFNSLIKKRKLSFPLQSHTIHYELLIEFIIFNLYVSILTSQLILNLTS